MDDETFHWISDRIEELYEFCSSNNLSLNSLQEKVSLLKTCAIIKLPESIYEEYPLLHAVCMNKNVTLEIIKYLVHTFPNTNGEERSTFKFCPNNETEAYLLHLACYNKDCPSDVIRFLVEHYPPALQHACTIDEGIQPDHPEYYIQGLPLHNYLARNKNVDIDIVKLLVEAYPQSLRIFDQNWPCYPIHVALPKRHCINKDILMCLLEVDPASIHLLDGDGRTVLHLACYNEHSTLEIYQFILNKWPEAIRIRDDLGSLPIHALSMTNTLDEVASIDILRSMLDIDLNLVRERDFDGYLPVHHAAMIKSSSFCKILIDLYPESLRVGTHEGSLPIHECAYGDRNDSADTIQYMLELYPESINIRDGSGYLPIHCAAGYGNAKAIELLLKHDPTAATKKTSNANLPHHHASPSLPLHLACEIGSTQTLSIQILYDAYPEAIFVQNGDGRSPISLARNRGSKLQPIVRFLEEQLVYAQTAKDSTAMHTLDNNGWLPLHHTLMDKAPLGSLKLLLKGNPSAVQTADNKLAFPLHIACEFSSVGVVQYLVGKSNNHILGHLDANKDSILHYACRGGNLEVVKYLLTNQASLVASAEMNEKGKLPIQLLCEGGKDKVNYDSTEYTEIIWRMLLANPEAVARGLR